MPLYRSKKPRVIRAIQWTGDNLPEVETFVGRMQNMDGDVDVCRILPADTTYQDSTEHVWDDNTAHLWVEANHTWVPLPVGQWVLEDSAGFYPCKPDIFEQTYELAWTP